MAEKLPFDKHEGALHVEDGDASDLHKVDESMLDPEIHLSAALQHEVDKDEKRVKRILRKVDWRLVPLLGLLYSWALIDRVNLPNVQIAGMAKELHTNEGNRYTVLSMTDKFFITYVLFDFPANIAIRKVGATKWLGFIGTSWGCLTVAMGFCRSWKTLLVCRVIFGALEAGMAPGSIYLLSCWYTRYEVQKRFAAWACVGVFLSGLASLLAYGISTLGVVDNLQSWRWIFIIEGIASAAVGIAAGLVLLDFPDRAARRGLFGMKGFLTTEEAEIILTRVERDRSDAVPERMTLSAILRSLRDWKMWQFPFLLFCNNLSVYSFSLFLPLILEGSMGYSLKMTYVLGFPPYALAALWMFAAGWLGDKIKMRGPIIVAQALSAILGVCMMAFLKNPAARYVGVFLGVGSINSNIPTIYGYQHNNLTGQVKRALATAMLIGGGGCGGVAASNVFRQQDAPNYMYVKGSSCFRRSAS